MNNGADIALALLAAVAGGCCAYAAGSLIVRMAAATPHAPTGAGDGLPPAFRNTRRLRLAASWKTMPEMAHLRPRLAAVAAFMLVAVAAANLTSPVIAIASTATMAALGAVFAAFARHRRAKLLRRQLISVIDGLQRGAQAGLPLERNLLIAATGVDTSTGPLARLAGEIAAGAPVPAVAERLRASVRLPEAQFFALALIIQHQTGGSGQQTLAELAALLRQRGRFQSKLGALTAEAKSSAIIISALPVVTALALGVVAPGYLDPLIHEPLGQMILLCAGSWMAVGIAVIHILSRVEA